MKIDKAMIFGSSVRLKILACLRKKSKTVGQLIKNCQLSQSAVSQHLTKLKRLGLINGRRQGKEIYYQLTKKNLGEIAYQLLVYLKKL